MNEDLFEIKEGQRQSEAEHNDGEDNVDQNIYDMQPFHCYYKIFGEDSDTG